MNRDVTSVDLSTEDSGLFSITTPPPFDKNAWKTLSESTDLFFKSLKLGRVRGLVNVVDVPNSRSQDGSGHMQLTRELIKRDILVTVSGRKTMGMPRAEMTGQDVFQSAGDGLAEFCDFIGIHPVLHIDGTIDRSDILDFYKELARHAAVTTSDLPAAAVAPGRHQAQTESPGTVFTMGDDPVTTADIVDAYIHDKRLGIRWCDRCDCRFSPFS